MTLQSTAGMATIAGTVVVLYASILGDSIRGVMGHILTASIISIPAAVTISKIMIPETEQLTSGEMISPEKASRQRKALKYWQESITIGEKMRSFVELSRTYFEVGKRLLEDGSKQKNSTE